MLFKNYKFDVDMKALTEDGQIAGHGSAFAKDLGGDIVSKGAFTKTIQERVKSGKPFPMLWNHNDSEPIGGWDPNHMGESGKGLKVLGQFILSVQRAAEVRDLAKAGVLGGLSIGYEIPKGKSVTTRNDDGTGYQRVISEIKLWEISVVTFPMNLRATISDVKCTNCGHDTPSWYASQDIGETDNPDADFPLILPADLEPGKTDSTKPCGCKTSAGVTPDEPNAADADGISFLQSLEQLKEQTR